MSGPFGPVMCSVPVVGGGIVAAERSPPSGEGELCGVSSSVKLGWNRRQSLFVFIGTLIRIGVVRIILDLAL